MRNDLNGGAQVIAAPLFCDHALVNSSRGEIAVARRGRAHEALVVAQIQVGFGAVVGDENFAVLEGAHGARIHIDVGIELHHAHFQPTRFENRA